MPESRIQTYIKVAICLASIRLFYAVSKELAFLAVLVFLGVAAWQNSTSSTNNDRSTTTTTTASSMDADERMRLNMERMDRERIESENMMHEAARMMLDINRRHLDEFLITHPEGTYEQWIGKLHPDNVDGTTVDHRFYVEDSDHRILWNDNIGDLREFVEVRSSKQNKEVETV